MPLPQLFLHDEAATGVVETRSAKAARMMREGAPREQVLKDDNLLAEILSAPGNRKPLSEICELVRNFCASNKCSADVYRTVMQEGMGIKVDKPDDMGWNEWINSWCKVVQSPNFYFVAAHLFEAVPTKYDPAASLKWAHEHNLVEDLMRRTFGFALIAAAHRLDIAVIRFFYNTYRLSLPNIMRVVDLFVKTAVAQHSSAASASSEPSLGASAPGSTDLHVDAFLELLKMYDTLNTEYYTSDDSPPHSMNMDPARVRVPEVWNSMRQTVREYATAADNNQQILQWIQEKEAEQAALERAALAALAALGDM